MSWDTHNEHFDRAMQELMQGAETPVPPGVWEAVSGGIAASAGQTTTVLLAKWIALKWAAGIAVLSLVSVITYQLIQPENPSVDSSQTNPSALTHRTEKEDPQPTNNRGEETVVTSASDLNVTSHQGKTPSTLSDSEPKSTLPAQTMPSEVPLNPNPEISAPLPLSSDPHSSHQEIKSPFRLVLSTLSPCSGEPILARLEGFDGVNVPVYWSVDGKRNYTGSQSETFILNGGMHNIRAKVMLPWNSQEVSLEQAIRVSQVQAGFNSQLEPGVLELTANRSNPSDWYVDGVIKAENTSNLKLDVENNRSYTIMQICRKEHCSDTATESIAVTWLEKSDGEQSEIWIPNVFSPYEEDGKNDYFEIRLVKTPEEYHLQVVDGRGNSVFESENPQENWNGRLMNRGDLMPEGWYHYFLYLRQENEEISRVGKVMLIK